MVSHFFTTILSLPEIQIYTDMLHFSGNLNWIQAYNSPSTFLDLCLESLSMAFFWPCLRVQNEESLRPRGPIHLEHKPSSSNNQDTKIIYKCGWKSTFKAAWISSSHPSSLQEAALAVCYSMYSLRHKVQPRDKSLCGYKKILAVKMFFHIHDIQIRNWWNLVMRREWERK